MAGVHITPVYVAGNNGAGVSVKVNSCIPPGSSMAQSQSGTQVAVPRRGVTITRIQTGEKAQSATKTFVLRGINASTVTTCSHLKALIRKQVGEEIIKGDFDVGYLQGSNVITMIGSAIRNMMLANSANLQAADSPRWTNLIRDAKSVATPTVM